MKWFFIFHVFDLSNLSIVPLGLINASSPETTYEFASADLIESKVPNLPCRVAMCCF